MLLKTRKPIILLLACTVLLAGCTKQVHVKHPDQVNDLDGYAYDALTIAQGTLDEAKAQLNAGKFDTRHEAAVEIINRGGFYYDAARVTWNTYHSVLGGFEAGDIARLETQLRSDLTAMSEAIKNVKDLTGGAK